MAIDYTHIKQKYFEESTPQNAASASVDIGSGVNGTVTVEYNVGTEGNDYSIVVDDSNSGDDDIDTTVDLTDGVITVYLGTDPDSDSTATIGSGNNGTVTVTVDPTGVDENDYTIEVVTGADNGALAANLVGEAITVTLGMTAATVATSSIGSGDNGTVNMTTLAKGTAQNDYTIEVVEATLDGTPLSASLAGKDIQVVLGTTDGDAATATIGSGANGTVTAEIDANGSAGNDYTIAVDAGLTVQDRALGAVLAGTDITVSLATEGNTSATASIGSGDNGTVNILVDAVGSNGNDYTIAVDASLDVQDRTLIANLAATDVTISLATEGDAKANASIGSGVDGTVDIEVNAAGSDGNDYTVEVVEGVGLNVALSAALVGDDITVTLGTTPELSATATIGSGENGTVTVAVNVEGEAGNDYTIEVVEAAGQNAPMSAVLTGSELSVTLGTDGAGVLDPAKNTAALIAAAITGATFTAVASGTGAGSIAAAELEKSFTGGDDGGDISSSKNTAALVATAITNIAGAKFTATASGFGTTPLLIAEAKQDFENGTNKLKTASNTATLVAAAIQALDDVSASASGTGASSLTVTEAKKNFENGTNKLKTAENTATLVAAAITGLAGVTAAASGDGSTSLTLTEVQKNFTGGGENFTLDAAKNTATLVAGAINGVVNPNVTAVATGTGGTAISGAVLKKNFINGADSITSSVKNTATLVAAAVGGLAGVDAVASGTGATPLLVAEALKSFSGGSDTGAISPTKNTATLIADLINELDGFTATASGSGVTPLLSAEVSQDFTGGQYATEAKSASFMIIDGVWYMCNAPVSKWDETGWYSASAVTL